MPARSRDVAGLEDFRAACRSLAVFGTWAGWGLAVVGSLAATVHLVEMVGEGLPGQAGWVRAGLRAALEVMVFALAGWGVATLSRFAAALVLEYFERAGRVSDYLSSQAARGLALLERIAATMEDHGGPVVSSPAPGLERARSMAEIVRATRASEWVEAESLLREFEIEFPDDPELTFLKEDLARSRHDTIRETLAQLDAARGVNDPGRVLDLYQELLPSLHGEQRTSLDQDLGRWFLSLIHRRLRTGKIQPDVVQLAGRFAESFATTIEGASVRASLPTLRRSVGLCPRCAQPYTGVLEACPQCLKGAAPTVALAPADEEPDLPE